MSGTRNVRARLAWLGIGVLIGLLTAAAALGVAELVAAFISPQAAPVIAVGNRAILATPESVKEFAIRRFGEHDKDALLAGIYGALLGYAVIVGILSRWHRWIGVAGVALFGALGVGAALTQRNATVLDAVPSVVGALVGIAVLLALLHVDHPRSDTVEGPRARSVDGGIDRRRFVVLGAGAAVLAAVTGAGGRALTGKRFSAASSRAAVKIPAPASPARPVPTGTSLPVKGISPWRTPDGAFYRVDTALVLPQVPADTWRLKVHGMVDRELTFSFDDLLGRELIERDITMTCVSNEVGGNLVGSARWIGVRLRDILREAGVHSGADQIVSRSVDGMTIGTPTAVAMDGRDAMLAVAMNGEPLPVAHGFPVRMLVPGLYGYVSACKWIVDIELTTFDAYDPYWVQRKWKQRAPIKTSSRIDTPKSFANLSKGSVTIAGVAWAQHTGIRAVEVRVDDGPWRRAKLAATPSTDVWRQWSFDWAASGSGDHNLSVRAIDAAGRTQTGSRVTPFPDGSTGWHNISVTVK